MNEVLTFQLCGSGAPIDWSTFLNRLFFLALDFQVDQPLVMGLRQLSF